MSRTVNIGVSRLFPMAEAPKDVMVTSENVNTPQETMPQEEVRSTVPEFLKMRQFLEKVQEQHL